MPRDGSDVYYVPSGTYGVEDTTIESARYNAFVDDVAQDLNTPRPILAGGTDATNAVDAITNLGGELADQVITNYDSDPIQGGSFYSASSATSAPVAGHAFAGICYQTDSNNMAIEARDQNDMSVPGRKWVREKKAGVWSIWSLDGRVSIGTTEGFGFQNANMFFGVTGLDPNSQFIVNSKADASGANLLTVDKASGLVSGNGVCPPGAILDFGTPVPPPGWLLCDGSAVSRTAYANLFAAISTSWGAGDGSTTFNLPPLTDRFRRSIGPAAGGVGTLQEPANLTHTHPGTTGNNNIGHTHPVTGSTGAMSANASHGHSTNANAEGPEIYGTSVDEGWVVPQIAPASINPTNTDHVHAVNLTTGNQSASHTHPFTTGTGSADASEARPKSATVLTCIKT